jgi:hypothetical protein
MRLRHRGFFLFGAGVGFCRGRGGSPGGSARKQKREKANKTGVLGPELSENLMIAVGGSGAEQVPCLGAFFAP